MKHAADADAHWLISFEDFKKGLAPYTLDFVAELAKGDADEPLDAFKKKLKQLADLYIEKDRKVVSFWTMGFNQHYARHLGERADLYDPPAPRQTVAARQRRVQSHRPAERLRHGARSRHLLAPPAGRHGRGEPEAPRGHPRRSGSLPEGTLNPVPGSHFVKIMRDLEDGKIRWVWVQVNNPWQNTANANHWIKAAREMDNFIVVSEAYPGDQRKGRGPYSALCHDLREMGRLRERRAEDPALAPAGHAHGQGHVRHLAAHGVLEAHHARRCVEGTEDQRQGYPPERDREGEGDGIQRDRHALRRALREQGGKDHLPGLILIGEGFLNTEAGGDKRKVEGLQGIRVLPPEVPLGGVPPLRRRPWSRSRGFRHLSQSARTAVAGGGRERDALAFQREYDPYAKKADYGDFAFYGAAFKEMAQGDLLGPKPGDKVKLPNKAKIFLRHYMEPPEVPDTAYPDLALHRPRAGTLAQRHHDHAGARALSRGTRGALLHAPQ